ncbi:Zn(2)-Cys(6) binuclear cluster domain-containing protein [Mycena crocata]|nr:Zn(2)-Cys(6) binuclear cluster domain-containing protein [Mycena crocata]
MPTMTQSFFASSPTLHSPRSNLPRGKACMNCRRRKIKCDGQKPICSQCLRAPATAEDCEYPLEGRSRTQQLEETIKKLQARIGELEIEGKESIFLHEPYETGDVSFMAMEIPELVDSWASPGSGSVSPPSSSRVATPNFSSSSSDLVLEEPPPNIIEQLVNSFLNKFSQVGFFLDIATFRNSALLPFPLGHYDRPSPALLSAVYLWGARMSSEPRHPVYNEDSFLVCTLQNIHQDLSRQHPHRVMHTIQAEVLLSFYYLTLARPVEGIYHSSAAVSIALSAGLHLIKSTSQLQSVFGVVEAPFLPAGDTLEEGERINAFWTVVVMNNYWVAARGSPSAISYQETPIDTPWPVELGDYISCSVSAFSYASASTTPTSVYQQLLDSIAGSGGGTVSKFLGGQKADGFSALALLSKASILLERAITFSTRHSEHSDTEAFDSLDAILEQFELSLPLGMELWWADGPKRSLVVTQTLTQTAIMRLHAHRIQTSDVSRRKYLSAARAVVHIINSSDFSQWTHIDPIMGILWTTACEVFIAEMSSMQSFGVVGGLTQQHQDTSACLETILSAMRAFSGTSPVIDYFSTRVQQAYNAAI